MLRPRPARWFEILAARDDATLLLEALARTSAVELEARPGVVSPAELGEVLPLLARFLDLSARHRAYWPASASCRPSAWPQPPLATLQDCLGSIEGWAAEAESVIRALQGVETELAELQLWQRVLPALAERGQVDLGQLAQVGPLLQVRLVVLPGASAHAQALPADLPGLETLASLFEIDGVLHALVAGSPSALQALAQRLSAAGPGTGQPASRLHAPPAWLQADAQVNQAHLQQRQGVLAAERASQHARLEALHAAHDLHRALGDAYRLQWMLDNVHALEAGPLLCWITGWTIDAKGERMAQALQASGARALLRFAPVPAGLRAPLLLVNPPWAHPFEIFSRALGMPSSDEADPTPLLALVVPLMFGYMFGDLGQGLVIAAAGWYFRARWPVARLLMIGGLSAAFFGLVFGSVFGVHGLLVPLWLHPLDRPLAVLLAPLVGGALLLSAGLALAALAAWWRGEFGRWLLTDAALVVVYLALLAAFVAPPGLVVAAAAALWFGAGNALLQRRFVAAFAALGELLEKTLQILINTLSFARVGAFALAHAGLSSAIVALVDAADSLAVKAVVMVIGNAVVIVLEAMVVSIQTTRLVLFEFFTRFMHAQGRAFRPLPAPPYT